MTFRFPNKLPAFFLLLTILGLFFHLPAPRASRATVDKFYTVEVWKFETEDGAHRIFDSLLHWLPPDKRDHLRIELIQGSFALRVGKTDKKIQADQLLELVAERYSSATLLKSRYDRTRLVKLYRASHETPTPRVLPDTAVAAVQVPLILPPEIMEPSSVDEQSTQVTKPVDAPIQLKPPSPVPMKDRDTPVSQQQSPATIPVSPARVYTFEEPSLPEPDQKVFTVQAGSFKNIRRAKKYYADLEWLLTPSQRELLRIEQVKGFITVRVGSFATKAMARPLLLKVKELDKSAHILHTHILETRIEQLYREPRL